MDASQRANAAADPLAAALVRARRQRRRHLHRRVAAGRGGPARRPAGHHPLGDGRGIPAPLPARRLAARALRDRIGTDLLRRRRLLGHRSQSLPGREVLRARGRGRDGEGAAAGDAAHLAVGLRHGAAAVGPRRRRHPAFFPTTTRVQKAQAWLFRNFKQEVNLAQLAARVGMSPRNFARRFTAATGETPLAYLHRLRIDAARHLLETRREHRRRQPRRRLRGPELLPAAVQAPHRRAAARLPVRASARRRRPRHRRLDAPARRSPPPASVPSSGRLMRLACDADQTSAPDEDSAASAHRHRVIARLTRPSDALGRRQRNKSSASPRPDPALFCW